MSSKSRKVLIADDEARMRTLVHDYLRMRDFQVLEAENSREAPEVFQWEPDIALTLLDVMMSKMDGFETSKEFRHTSDVPVLVLTACAEEQDELQGFSLGAGKYITRPFGPKVLLARIDMILKCISVGTDDEQLETIGVCLGKRAREITVDDKKMEPNLKESELLRYFLENQGIALSREKILNHVWNYDYFGDARIIDTHAKKLRTGMGEEDTLIRTVRGTGYRFGPEEV